MTTICLFVFVIIFFQTTAKNFLISLDKDKSKDLHDDSEMVENEQGIEVEKGNKADETDVDMAKKVELKAAGTDTVRDNLGHLYNVASDYSYSDKSGTWECQYKKSKR